MSFTCDCACARELTHLRDQVRLLEHQLTQMRRDLENEIVHLDAAVRELSNEISDAYLAAG